MNALSHIRDPQRESIFAALEEMRDLASSVLRNPRCPCFSDPEPCAWCRPVVRRSRDNTTRPDAYGEADVMGENA